MYNRYIPQSDGTYRKRKISDTASNHPPQPDRDPPPAPAPIPFCPPQEPPESPPQPRKPPAFPPPQNPGNLMGFFKNLLPKNMDTADLLIVMLLLLMAGDCGDDKNTALLTLALYFLL